MQTRIVLALNSGSSSLKFALYEFGANGERLRVRGEAEEIGKQESRMWMRGADGSSLFDRPRNAASHEAALRSALDELNAAGYPTPSAIGHRVVNGGPQYHSPQRITPQVVVELRSLIPLAPLHLPAEIKIIEAVGSQAPQTPQVACFDTAFHRKLPEIAQMFPLPRRFYEGGIRRYGFHGLSYEYVLQELGQVGRAGRVIIAHLGNGASLAAIQNGLPTDTSMGLTPTGGIMMGTRTGDLDPGVLSYLMREKKYDLATLDRVVDSESGLLGVSGQTSDMKTLLSMRPSDSRADQAVTMFCRSVRKEIGAFAAVLGGVDLLVFTGGIGERAAPVREEICRNLGHLGVRLDLAKNNDGEDIISQPGCGCEVRIVRTNEELMIARHTHAVITQE